jgi:hypothetical protein
MVMEFNATFNNISAISCQSVNKNSKRINRHKTYMCSTIQKLPKKTKNGHVLNYPKFTKLQRTISMIQGTKI